MRTFALCSGSSGNCFYVENNFGDKILIDFGISFKRAKEILLEKNINIEDIDAVFITHEHSDHIRGLKVLSKKVDMRVYMTKGTADFLNIVNFELLEKNKRLSFKNFNILPIEKSHDAVEPVNFIIESDNSKIGFFSDMGYIDNLTKSIIKELDLVYFEANYDTQIINPNKSFFYIDRCLSEYGHLDSKESIEFLAKNLSENQKVVFCHISENNNCYKKLENDFKEILKQNNKNIDFFISYQKEAIDFIEVNYKCGENFNINKLL